VRSDDLVMEDLCLRIPVAPGEPAERILIPIIDLLNHNTRSAKGSWDGDAFSVDVRHPFSTDECGLDYGLARDDLGTAVVYGFIDTSATLAHSAPVVVDMSGGARLQVMGDARDTDGILVSINAIANGDVMSVNRLTFSSDDPDSTVQEVAAATGLDAPHARVAAAAILCEAARVQRSVVEVFD
jgi:hypothetical protein